jgi:hypothetical protein
VAILRKHLDHYGAAPDGRPFPALSGGRVRESVGTRIWKEAREIGLSPAQAASPLAARPYDLRHAALLLSVYAACLDGERDAYNACIQDLLDGAA